MVKQQVLQEDEGGEGEISPSAIVVAEFYTSTSSPEAHGAISLCKQHGLWERVGPSPPTPLYPGSYIAQRVNTHYSFFRQGVKSPRQV